MGLEGVKAAAVHAKATAAEVAAVIAVVVRVRVAVVHHQIVITTTNSYSS